MSGRGFVIARISGGMGNQMFQYAAGRAVALRTNQRLYLDLETTTTPRILLDAFRLGPIGDLGPALALRAGLSPWPRRAGTRYVSKLSARLGVTWVQPKHFGVVTKDVLGIHGPAVLQGHWQSEDYFADFADRIRVEFAPRDELRREVADLVRLVGEGPSVSIHVRRGDYLTYMPQADLPTREYYVDAYAQLCERLRERPHVFGFSDDSAWLRDELRVWFPHSTPVSGAITRTAAEDLFAQAACQHQIIAPSTFSWWAAWLNPNLKKVVIAPKRWVYEWAARDVVPLSWIRV
jgi:hypothetical protein